MSLFGPAKPAQKRHFLKRPPEHFTVEYMLYTYFVREIKSVIFMKKELQFVYFFVKIYVRLFFVKFPG